MMVPAGGAALWREEMARIAGPRVGTYLFTEAEVDALCAHVWQAWQKQHDENGCERADSPTTENRGRREGRIER